MSVAGSFDYLSVLISIVLGLAIANVLSGLASIIAARRLIDFYWPPVAWAVWLFFIAVQHWWAQWGVRHTQQWTFIDFWLLLLTPVDLFLLSALILPQYRHGEKIDLSEWYFHNRVWFFAIVLFLPILAVAEELVRSGHMSSLVNLTFLIAFEIVAFCALLLKSKKAQEWITAQTVLLTLVYVGLLFFKLPS
jgi:hypothetical protein